ncbi:hypothetical protein VTL71DRAFT_1672 [Oculimacula yallundae]|uniref:Uncharacterized protein n=1 Tax=Oculimacula yallundae TaxID=86028 RepID=A0ABR4CBD9_9HELO
MHWASHVFKGCDYMKAQKQSCISDCFSSIEEEEKRRREWLGRSDICTNFSTTVCVLLRGGCRRDRAHGFAARKNVPSSATIGFSVEDVFDMLWHGYGLKKRMAVRQTACYDCLRAGMIRRFAGLAASLLALMNGMEF